MNDLISRQDVLKLVDKGCLISNGNHRKVRKMVEALPSAQPERTCVNCGRTVNNGGWYADGGTRCPIEEHYALPKDGYCHLWEKRNVTDDDYPERRTDERFDIQTGGGLVHWKDIEDAPTVDAEPIILSVGVVKEYDNGMVAMRKETYQEYHAIAVNEAVRRLDIEVLSEIERSTST